MPEPILTMARRSIWDAIEHWPPLEGAIKRTWKFDDMGAMQCEPTPTLGDLPALAIHPSRSSPSDWALNQSQIFPYRLEATLWTRHWSLGPGERLWEEITRAVFQSAPPGGPTYLFTGTGFNDVELGGLAVERKSLGVGGPVVAVWTWTIGLKIKWNPSL